MNSPLVEIVAMQAGAEVGRYPLLPGIHLIGRDADCTLRFEDEGLAARHAELMVQESGKVAVLGLGHGQGTFLGDAPVVKETPWAPGHILRVGSLLLALRDATVERTLDASPGAPAPVTPPSRSPIAPLESLGEDMGGGDLLQRHLRLTERPAQALIVGDEVARGGMGAVHMAKESATRRTVAMKVMLRPEAARESLRFIGEARVTAQLEHPNIVPIYDLGVDAQGHPFYTMKLVEGITLKRVLELLKEGVPETVARYPLGALLTIFQKLCDALAFAHARGVIHRDLKPANIMLGKYGEVLVMDWGLAKVVGTKNATLEEGETVHNDFEGPTVAREAEAEAETAETASTRAGSILGTPQYMSPEQARGEVDALDARSDIFVLGAILYEVLTLERAFGGNHSADIIARIGGSGSATVNLSEPAVGNLRHLPGGNVPESLLAVIRQAMAFDRTERYATVMELQRDIAAFQNGFATSAERASLRKQLVLLIKRNRGVFGTAFGATILLLAVAGWFMVHLHASERRATHNAQLAARNEKKAVEEKEAARKALARAQIAVADEAFRRSDVAGMVQALEGCPGDLRNQTWQYLSAKRDTSAGDLTLPGFEAPVAVLAWPGHRGDFVLANEEGEIGIANALTKKLVRKFATGQAGIKLMAVSGNGHQVAVVRTGSAQIDLYNLANGAHQKSLTLPADNLQRLALSADGASLAAVLGNIGEKMDLLFFSTRDGQLRWRKEGQFSGVLIHPDGDRMFVSGTGQGRLHYILRTTDGSEISRTSIFPFSQALSPDGKTLAVGTQQGEVVLIDTVTGAETQRGKLHASGLRELAWTSDGHLITMGSEGKVTDGRWVLKLWETEDLSLKGTFFGLKSGPTVHWSLDPVSGSLLTEEKPPRLWRIPIGLEWAKIVQTSEQAWSGCFLSDKVVLARTGYVLGRYDLSKPAAVELPWTSPAGYVLGVSDWRSGLFAVARKIGNDQFGFKILATQGDTVVEKASRSVGGRIMHMDFDASAQNLAVVYQNGQLGLYATRNGASGAKIAGKYDFAVFAGEGENLVAVSSVTRTAEDVQDDMMLLDGTTGKPLATASHRMRTASLAASVDRKLVALGGSDQIVHVYDAATLQERISFRAHDGEVGAVAFHPSLPILATASVDGSVKLWDYRNARLLESFLGLSGAPMTLAFSPNGHHLLVDGIEHTTRIYDVSHVKAP